MSSRYITPKRSYPFAQSPQILDRAPRYRHHLEALLKMLPARTLLLRRFTGSEWGARATTRPTASLSLVYSTAEYCTPLSRRSSHTQLINSGISDAPCIISKCLRFTPSEYLLVLSDILPAELLRQGATLSIANRGCLDPDHILHGLICWSQNVSKETKILTLICTCHKEIIRWSIGNGHPNVPVDEHIMKHKYSKSMPEIRAFIHRVNNRPLGMSLPRASWIKLNSLRFGVRRLCLSMYKQWLATFSNCKCGGLEQTAKLTIHLTESNTLGIPANIYFDALG